MALASLNVAERDQADKERQHQTARLEYLRREANNLRQQCDSDLSSSGQAIIDAADKLRALVRQWLETGERPASVAWKEI